MLDDGRWLIAVLIISVSITLCVVATNICGCVQDGNKRVQELAAQGIRAEVDSNGHIRVLDTRDLRLSIKEQK